MVSILVVSNRKDVTMLLASLIAVVLLGAISSHLVVVEGFQQHIAYSIRHQTTRTVPSSSSLHLFSSGKEKKEKVANIDKFEYNFGGDDDGNDDDKDSSSLFSSFGNKKEKKESAAVVVVAADDSSSSLFSSFGNKKEKKVSATTTTAAAAAAAVVDDSSSSSSSLNLFSSFGNKKEEKKIAPASVVVVEEDNDDNNLFGWTDFGTSNPISFVYGGAWLALLSLLALGPGELNGAQDNALLQAIIANPAAPEGVNPFYYGIFNVFVLIPIVLGCTMAPRTNDEGIQAGTPIFLSSFIAYFVMGPYLALRKTPKTEFGVGDSLGWLTRNVWENKLFNWATVAFGFYALYAGAAPGLNDPATNFQGLIDFITTSRFASVSIADLSLITLILTKEVTDDYKIRCRGSTAENINRAPFIGASTALLPVLGAAIYCALRPSLVADEDQF
eukprot:CAMPEP_0170975990 /NCGR_PEP_ID=MMETSP0735-20130129/48437_1 /TAXON_ID=186038 /ORGANISM="Fragilariopsis kerguelensis, Strain L26-C5" /LENGTH=443 /DNA_ID=CAMNT_0011397825 /DNA_START=91 /DNA_END=1422 /DNA_ORIENTATION=+